MKKKIIVSISVFLVCLIAVGGVYYFKTNANKPIKEISISASYKGYPSENKMNDDADIILYGSPADKFEDRKFVNNYSDGMLGDFYTLTKFKITKILKNTSGLSLKKEDLFNIIEPLTFIDDEHGKRILEIEGYKAMEKGTNYVVYLKNNGVGGYSVINMLNGRFDMDSDNESSDIRHQNIKKDILKKYSKDLSN